MQTKQALFDLTAADLMSREVITVPQEMSLPAATRALAEAQIGGAPVVDHEGRCIGVFSMADLARRAQLEKRAAQKAPPIPGCVCSDWEVVEHDWETLPADSVSWYMTADPVLVSPETRIGELARMMVDAHIHRLIVAGTDRRPTGIVSSTMFWPRWLAPPANMGKRGQERALGTGRGVRRLPPRRGGRVAA